MQLGEYGSGLAGAGRTFDQYLRRLAMEQFARCAVRLVGVAGGLDYGFRFSLGHVEYTVAYSLQSAHPHNNNAPSFTLTVHFIME